ncbi:TPA: HaeII family restriction endonuclease [Candidatus Uhrbacteria bacterium]|nr:HaeII family restriction endonuclease [Candidatus Uhrbacteria bacterium]
MPEIDNPKVALDKVINKSRVHFYKPFQIAETLHQHRMGRVMDLTQIEDYRNISKRWRDDVSKRLVGRVSTSSARFQDNVFDDNAMPPIFLAKLGLLNVATKGGVEAYIYRRFAQKLDKVDAIRQYIMMVDPSAFSLVELVHRMVQDPGLRRSVDKIYEITVYALFSTIVRALEVTVTLHVGNPDLGVLKDFEKFMHTILGLASDQTQITVPAALYRVGVTNAADRGLDMWSNFGPAVQVKHLTLTPDLMGEIVDSVRADRIVIVCLGAEKELVVTLLQQVDYIDKVQGIITMEDLDQWYNICLSDKYQDKLGKQLLLDLRREFEDEFPAGTQINPFMTERNYLKIELPRGWNMTQETSRPIPRGW